MAFVQRGPLHVAPLTVGKWWLGYVDFAGAQSSDMRGTFVLVLQASPRPCHCTDEEAEAQGGTVLFPPPPPCLPPLQKVLLVLGLQVVMGQSSEAGSGRP